MNEPRGLPHSLEVEELLLACCLLDGRQSVTRCIAARLKPESFYDARHGLVFGVLLEMHARQDEIADHTVAEELKVQQKLDSVGGYAFIAQLTTKVPSTFQLVAFITKVREYWIRREIIRFGKKLEEDSHGFTGGMTEWLTPQVSKLQAMLARVVHGERAGVTLEERVTEVRAEIAKRADGTEDKSGWVVTHMDDFDKYCRPLGSDAEDHLIVIGGGSGHGKSALMRQWAGEALKAGQRVVNYTRETSVKGWIRQLASNWARVDLRTLDAAPKDLVKRLDQEVERVGSFADKSLFVYQQEPGCNIETIEQFVEHARSWAWQNGAPHLMVIDYLQLFGSKKRANNREQEVAHISHTLQAIQRELGCVMLVGAQLNESGLKEIRSAKKDDDGRLLHRLPTAGDFRESQAIYHDADRVIAIYRPPEDCRGSDNYAPNLLMPEQWLCQIKRRYGGEGAVKCWFEKQYLNFRPFSKDEKVAKPVTAAPNYEGQATRGASKNDFRKGK
jgi:replicative DNA helicase